MNNPTTTGDQIAKLINDTVDDLESCWKENEQLREQLDAAVEALKEFENEYPHVTRVLAKLKQ